MNRYIALAILLTLFIVSTGAAGGQVGVTSVCKNNSCYTTASASPMSVVFGAVTGLFALFCPRLEMVINPTKPVGIFQRLGAFYIDVFAIASTLIPAITLPVLFFEAQATGAFAWSFDRDFARLTDSFVIILGVLLTLFSLVMYFYFYASRNRQTIGQYILGYKVVPVIGGHPDYRNRTTDAVVGMCMWPISAYRAAKRLDKAFWWDRSSDTKVVRVTEKP